MAKNGVSLVTIGDELLLGQIIDTNSAWLGQELALKGLAVVSKYTVQDEIKDICNTLALASQTAKYVIISGGLGPTSDDVTLDAAAVYFKDDLQEHEPSRLAVEAYFESRGRKMSSSHSKQFFLPSTATVFINKVGTAPGFQMFREGTYYFFVPGVPVEMKYLFEHFISKVTTNGHESEVQRYHLFTAGIGETSIVDLISDELENLPSYIKMAYLPYHGGVRIRITGLNIDSEDKVLFLEDFKHQIISKLGDHFIIENHNEWATVMAELLQEKSMKLATGESCTGGYIAHKITSLPGSSAYFMGSVIAYDNKVKSGLLNVKTETLKQMGAVSEQCASEMLQGLCQAIDCDVAIVTTGIAGPGGGSAEKPVGTIYIGVGNAENHSIQKFVFRSSRQGNIESTYSQSMYMLFKFLSNQ